ncbi:lipocalin family protein [uncultured Shewanella sp.]|uniref:lipocalin family protein n=1 Tax=uncultured Shewanella sp. TaxID=173975 RepID=UPI002631960B|nr:lipocalin family protein [uncultured Shewanella sp.]
MKKISMLVVLFLLSGCLGMPKNMTPVKDFDVNRYVGTWYEIARLDHSFERGLTQVTAQYILRDDGGVNVINCGFSPKNDEWKEAQGKAYFVQERDKGYLKVSFFGPFYGSYVIFNLFPEKVSQQNYQYAFVSGPDLSYLWLLSRTPTVPSKVLTDFIAQSKALGFDTDALILVEQAKR